MNNIYHKLLPFLLGAIIGYYLVRLLLVSPAFSYVSIERLVNIQRTYPLIDSPKLDLIASCRAKYLVNNNLWTHKGYQKCFNKYGIYNWYGEILAKNFENEDDIVTAWLDSPIHKQVMLGEWRFIGSSEYKNITVVVFN